MSTMAAPVVVRLVNIDLATVTSLAQASLSRWKDHNGHYTNSLRSHWVGRAGEQAVSRWLASQDAGYWPHCDDPAREPLCDIELFWPHLRLEVKTWSARYWPELGRCIAKSQAEHLARKADAVVWCVAADVPDLSDPRRLPASLAIELRGWSLVAEILATPARLTGPEGGRQVLNHQVAENTLRSMESLLFPE